jgi:peptide deformylase
MIQEIVKAVPDLELLKSVSMPVSQLDDKDDIANIIQDLIDTLGARHGKIQAVGIAAPQIRVLKRIIAINYGQHKNLIMINPVITEATGRIKHDEMCLSFPGMFKRKIRRQYIKVNYLDRNMNPREQVFTAMEAFIVQHEVDHLDGKVLSDH